MATKLPGNTHPSLTEIDSEPHTLVIKYLGQGKGRIETTYFGEAMPPIEKIKDLSQLRVTKGKSIDEILERPSWFVSIKRFFNSI